MIESTFKLAEGRTERPLDSWNLPDLEQGFYKAAKKALDETIDTMFSENGVISRLSVQINPRPDGDVFITSDVEFEEFLAHARTTFSLRELITNDVDGIGEEGRAMFAASLRAIADEVEATEDLRAPWEER